MEFIPVSAIVPTRNRSEVLKKTFDSLFRQSVFPQEIIVIDGSNDDLTRNLIEQFSFPKFVQLIYRKAEVLGAAAQRNQAFELCTQDFVLFMDDDILFEEECLSQIWNTMQTQPNCGGVNAMISNQKYQKPGRITQYMYRFMAEFSSNSYAGKCIGPAINLLPEDRDDLPEIVEVEWLNSTCTMYHKRYLPKPLFDAHFKGYSLMEDLALSLRVSQNSKLYNARTARIFHDSQPGTHKKSIAALSQMDCENRWFVMTQILNRKQFNYLLRFWIWQIYTCFAVLVSTKSLSKAYAVSKGKFSAVFKILL